MYRLGTVATYGVDKYQLATSDSIEWRAKNRLVTQI